MPNSAPVRTSTEPFWPFSLRAAWSSSLGALVGLAVLLAVVRSQSSWLDDAAVGWVLLGIAVLALSPVLLVVLGRIADRGGSVTLPGGFGLAFAGAADSQVQSGTVRISANLGAPPGANVFDSGGGNIMSALGRAVSNPVVVVDLEAGDAWWETRLVILLAGGERLGSPRAVAFTATSGGKPGRFVGWAPTTELLRCIHATSAPDIFRELHLARGDALRWRQGPPDVGRPPGPPELAPEAMLLQHMAQLEQQQPRRVTVQRLAELFEPVLRRGSIGDEDDAVKARKITETTDAFIAVTSDGRFVNLIPRAVAVNAILQSLLGSSVAGPERAHRAPGAQPPGSAVPRQASPGHAGAETASQPG